MSMRNALAVEFDDSRRILHLSSSEPLEIREPDQLDVMCHMVHDLLAQYGPKRLYMIVDITNIAIDPSLSEAYGRKIRKIAEQFLYPGGIARYGYQITRVTVELGLSSDEYRLANLFQSRAAAEQYIDSLIAGRVAESTSTSIPPGTTCN